MGVYEMDYWFRIIKDGETVPYPHNMDRITCPWDKDEKPLKAALDHFESRPEVTKK